MLGLCDAVLTTDELVAWLIGIVPCLRCESVEDYLRKLVRRSAGELLQAIEDYEQHGRVARPTCECPDRNLRRSNRAPSPPPATCILSEESSWPFDLQSPSEQALHWIKQRLQERRVLEKMKTAWTAYCPQAILSFVPQASFRNSTAADPGCNPQTTFGPCGDYGVVLRLLSEDIGKQKPAETRWHAFLERPGPCVADTTLSGVLDEQRDSEKRPTDAHPGLTLSHVVATMVMDAGFHDEDALAVFGGSRHYTVEVHPFRTSPSGATSMLPHTTQCISQPTTLNDICGVTVLFLGCLALKNEEACDKLLDMRDTGAAILKDLSDGQVDGVLGDRVLARLRRLFSSAMGMETVWTIDALSCRLFTWATFWLRQPSQKQERSLSPDGRFTFDITVCAIFQLWNNSINSCGDRLFTPDTTEGWEDTAEVTGMGVLYGCAVAIACIRCLKDIGRDTDCEHPESDFDTAPSSFALSLFKAAFQVHPSQCSETVLIGQLAALIVEDGTPLSQDIDAQWSTVLSLCYGLQNVRRNLQAISKHYEQQVDGRRLFRAFRQSFSCIIRPYSEVASYRSDHFFHPDQPSSAIKLDKYRFLGDGKVTHYNPAYGKTIFQDLASQRLEWSDQPKSPGHKSRLRDIDLFSSLRRLDLAFRDGMDSKTQDAGSDLKESPPSPMSLSISSDPTAEDRSPTGLRQMLARFRRPSPSNQPRPTRSPPSSPTPETISLISSSDGVSYCAESPSGSDGSDNAPILPYSSLLRTSSGSDISQRERHASLSSHLHAHSADEEEAMEEANSIRSEASGTSFRPSATHYISPELELAEEHVLIKSVSNPTIDSSLEKRRRNLQPKTSMSSSEVELNRDKHHSAAEAGMLTPVAASIRSTPETTEPVLSQKRINAWDSLDAASQYHLMTATPMSDTLSTSAPSPPPSIPPELESPGSPPPPPSASLPPSTQELTITIPTSPDAAWVPLPVSFPPACPKPAASPSSPNSPLPPASPQPPPAPPPAMFPRPSERPLPRPPIALSETSSAPPTYSESVRSTTFSDFSSYQPATGALVLLTVAMLAPSSFSGPLILVVLLFYFAPSRTGVQRLSAAGAPAARPHPKT